MAVDICQAAGKAVMVIRKAFVIEAEDVQNRGMEIVDGGGLLDRFIPEFVGGAVADAFFHSGAGHPGGEPGGVVIAAAGAFLESGHAAEFGAPDDEGVLEQASLFQVDEEGGGWLVHDLAVFGILFVKDFMAVPVAHSLAAGLVGAIEQLDEAHAFFDQSPGE